MSERTNSIFRTILTGSAWSFIGVFLTAAFFLLQEYRNPYSFKIEMMDEFNLVEVREQIGDLKILYKNEDIIENKKEIKVIRIQVKNGGKTILQGHYDQLEPFGMRFINSKVLAAEVIYTNSEDLQRKLINGINDGKSDNYSDVIFSKVIFEKGDFAVLKTTILFDESEKLKIIPLGKIANIEKLKIDAATPESKNEFRIAYYIIAGYFGFLASVFLIVIITDFLNKLDKKRKIKTFTEKNKEPNEAEEKIINYYLETTQSKERIIKSLLRNEYVLNLKQIKTSQTNGRSFIHRLNPLSIIRSSEFLLQTLPKEIFYTDGSTVTFNKENEKFIIAFFSEVLLNKAHDVKNHEEINKP